MPTTIKLWQIEDEKPIIVKEHKIDLESRLEEWLCNDIALVSNNLLVIGQQVETSYRDKIDLLAIDKQGNLVILELKRDKTVRNIVGQTLDYASWIQNLGHEEINKIFNDFLNSTTLEKAFQEKFDENLPEVLNERHRIYIVASSLDSATERIIKYLSETHDVDINVVNFVYFKTEQGEFLARSLLLDETEVQSRAENKSKRKPPRSWEELRELAEKNGVVDLYNEALSKLRPLHDSENRTRTNVALIGYMGENKVRNTIISIYPEFSNAERGLVLQILVDRLCEYFNIREEEFRAILGPTAKDVNTWAPNYSWYFDKQHLDDFINLLSAAKK